MNESKVVRPKHKTKQPPNKLEYEFNKTIKYMLRSVINKPFIHPSIFFRSSVAGAEAYTDFPLPLLCPALSGGSWGVPKPAATHSPSSFSWLFPGWDVPGMYPLFTQVPKTCGHKSNDTTTKLIIELRPRVSWCQVHVDNLVWKWCFIKPFNILIWFCQALGVKIKI